MKKLIKTAGACGILCDACGIFIATKNQDNETLNLIAERLNIASDKIRCEGCRSSELAACCSNCTFRACVISKEISFCSDCLEFPCQKLKEFQTKMPHRVELFQSLELLKKVGQEEWYDLMIRRNSCENCGHVSGWYDSTCKYCGQTPSSLFSKENSEVLKKFINK